MVTPGKVQFSLGFMVNEGLVCLEEVCGHNGVLENIYVRV